MRIEVIITRVASVAFGAARRAFAAALATLALCIVNQAHAATVQWAGRTWNLTSGDMAGVAQGNPSNVSIDDNGYLHLKITKSGNTWTAAELFSTDKLGFGTYQWHVDAPIDRFDKNVVLGFYPYGPAAGIGKDGTNEIDIEYSRWGNENGVNGDWTDYPASGTVIGEKAYEFSLAGETLSTSRFVWSTSKIENSLLKGAQPVGSTLSLIESWTYAPNNSMLNIPQQALPLGMNLWCFDNPPSDGKEVEVVVRDFQFVPEGTNPNGSAGTGGASGSAGAAPGGGSSSGGTGGTSRAGTGGVSNAQSGAATGGTGSSSAGTSANNAGADNPAAGGNAHGVAGSSATGDAAGASAMGPESHSSSGCSFGGAPRTASWFLLLPWLAFAAWRRRAH